MVLNSKIEVRKSAIAGHGLYAKEPIALGEMVRLREGRLLGVCAASRASHPTCGFFVQLHMRGQARVASWGAHGALSAAGRLPAQSALRCVRKHLRFPICCRGWQPDAATGTLFWDYCAP